MVEQNLGVIASMRGDVTAALVTTARASPAYRAPGSITYVANC